MSLEAALARHQRGDLAGAEQLYREILRQQPDDPDALHLLGVVALQTGRPQAALEPISRSLLIHPRQPVAQLNLGVAMQQLDRLEEAFGCFERALELQPGYADALNNRADVLLQWNRPEEALRSLERALELRPDFAMALNNRGNALRALGRVPQALESYEAALRLEPGLVRALNNRGNALRDLGRLDEALGCFERALQLAPHYAPALHNRSNALLERGQYAAALQGYDRLLAAQPGDCDALVQRGITLLHAGRAEAARASFERALQLRPGLVRALEGLARALCALNRPEEALERYESALRLQPSHLDALFDAGMCCLKLYRWDRALAYLSRLCELAPAYPYAQGYRLHARLRVCDWTDVERDREALVAAVSQGRAGDVPFSFLAVTDSAAAQLRCARAFTADRYPARAGGPSATAARAHDRIRLAYVSGDLREHIVARLLAGVFERHDRRRFEVCAIALNREDGSAIGARVRRAFDRYVEAGSRSAAEIAELMRAMRIDIAVDLAGYTETQRMELFAARCAPVQVSYLGFPGTLGAPYMDYLIADEFVIPESSRKHYAEQVVYLPDSFHPADDRRAVPARARRMSLGLRESDIVCCSLNNSYKYSAPMLDIWARVLRQVPQSVLWLLANDAATEASLRREAHARGIEPDRLLLSRRVHYEDHLARLTCADLFLDTLPFGAGATASDVLWAGVPLLTCAGEAFASRMAGSLLRTAGLPELVTFSLQEYERRALELLSSPARLAELRSRVEEARQCSALFDTGRYTRSLEAAYRQMAQRARRGDRPTRIRIGPTLGPIGAPP